MIKSNQIAPPRVPLRLLRWFCDPLLLEDVEGDITELFATRLEKSKARAFMLLWLDVAMLFRPGIIRNFSIVKTQINISMLNNFLKIALRNAMRYKSYSVLNLLGLMVGIASSMLILLWVNDEVSVNQFHENGDHIYQIFRNMRQSNGIVETTMSTPKPAGDLIKAEYSEVSEVAYLSWQMEKTLSLGDVTITESGFHATPSFWSMFSFDLLYGDPKSMLDDLKAIVISESVAAKHFGPNWGDEILGKTLQVDGEYEAMITGVFANIGSESTLRFDWLIPAQTFYNENKWVEDWGNGSFKTYITIKDQLHVDAVADRIYDEIIKYGEGNSKVGEEYLVLHKFADVYLHSNFDNGVVSGGRIDYVRILSVVAIFLLVVACINFMNLATARASRRSKEIGLRKVMGSQKRTISIQFYFEAFHFVSVAILLSVLLVFLLLPYFNQLVNKTLFLDFTSITTWGFLFSLAVILSLLSGSYPAVLLPTFNIMQSLKGGVKQSSFSSHFRKGLVVFQFAISMFLITGTAVIYKQLDYVLTKDLGLEKDNLISVHMEGDLASRLDTYKTELLRIPEVKMVTTMSGNPINYGRSTSSANWEGKNPSEGYEVNIILTDEHFIKTMGMQIKAGRDFTEQVNDSTNFLINEVAVELMGFDEPVGKSLSFWGIEGKVVGVIKNFHMRDMYQPIAPLIVTCIDPSETYKALIRFQGNPNDALEAIERVTMDLNPKFEFQYEFVDQSYAESYENEQMISTLINLFALIAIFISCLGIYGLASYSADQRSREIGVRKVHGASINQILMLLSKDYAKLMVFAFVFSIPFGYYFAQNWLNDFEFRTSLDPVMFMTAGAIVFVIGIATVMLKSYYAASINPTNSLKEE